MNETLICCAVLVWGILSIMILRRFLYPPCKHQWAKMTKGMIYLPNKDKKDNFLNGVAVLQKCIKCDLEQAWFEAATTRVDLQTEYVKSFITKGK